MQDHKAPSGFMCNATEGDSLDTLFILFYLFICL